MRLAARSLGSPRVQDARTVLGPDHALVRAEERMRALRRQATAIAVLLPACGPAVIAGAIEPHALVVAALAEAVLLASLMVVAGTKHRAALELIADRRAGLPVTAVQHELARLLDERHITRLADSLDALRCEAAHPYRDHPARRPLYDPATIRQIDGDLARTAALLREPRPDPVVIARIERLMCSECSPLYGDDPMLLRHALHRIRFTA